MLYNNLPVYKAKITDEDMGMIAISLVDYPATESNFLKFNADKKPMKFKIENEEKRIVFGLVMAANMPIYRRTGNQEWFIVYEPDTIRVMAEKFLLNGLQNRVDTQHDGNFVDGVNMVQMFIKDTKAGINPVSFEQFEDGSLFCSFHVENDDVWQSVKDGTFTGFSLEGYFSIEETEDTNIDSEDTEIMDIINKIKNKIKKTK